ncbi:hypothetical protein [Clostridium sp. SM-530-WT-3G]|uniref:hypothetical protein n=1 Tax=Clostridium sp. SM-530-WT-3G TaxID=2725303 RepID=UPI00145C594B|nr:hypothetical protein [Clostridium sp. SM-530-WT-3G]NME82139.1 hypothetical protein [Clostridium sp. SM-530-WT-3G]
MDREESDLLPGGLVTCLINNNEVTVVKLSPRKLTVRLCEDIEEFRKIAGNANNTEYSQLIKEKFSLKAVFYNFDKYKYEEIIINDYEIVSREEKEFYVTYGFLINNQEYKENVNRIFRDYSSYVRLKNYGIDNEYSEEMVGYPAEEDYDFYDFYSTQKKEWMSELDYSIDSLENVELAVSLHDDNLYKKFIELNIQSFKDYYLRENHIENHKIFSKDIDRVYIGNEFCHNLFPEVNLLIKMMDKAESNNLNITLCFTYLRDSLIEKTEEIIDKVYNWCKENKKQIEIVINDWGMIELLKDKQDYINICLGVLLNKRKKDPRYMYKKGYKENKNLIAENSLNSTVFRGFLKDNKIERYEYENCGYRMDIAEGNHSMHIPFYVTNTSQYCPLYAMCKHQNRGKQELVTNCPKYCKDYVFSYPKHLKMVGRYNSLFAFDDTLLKDKNKLEYYINSGIDRIVMNFI